MVPVKMRNENIINLCRGTAAAKPRAEIPQARTGIAYHGLGAAAYLNAGRIAAIGAADTEWNFFVYKTIHVSICPPRHKSRAARILARTESAVSDDGSETLVPQKCIYIATNLLIFRR